MSDKFFLDKHQVRRSFSRAAQSYNDAAILQKEVGNRMASRLSYIKHSPHNILDAGSGTGLSRSELQRQYPEALVIELDIALEMLMQSRTAAPPFGSNSFYLCADIECLPLSNASVDMVWSNLSMQWVNDLAKAFTEVSRALRNAGLFMFSTFGPDTLKELRAAFSHIDPYTHTNRFTDMHDIGDLLLHSGFETPVVDMEVITMTYPDLEKLLHDLKGLGAHNVTQGRNRGLTGRAMLKMLISEYEKFRQGDRLPATFEVIYGHAWKATKNEKRSPHEPQPIRIYPRTYG